MLDKFWSIVPPDIITALARLDLDLTDKTSDRAEINKYLKETVLFGGKRLRPLLLYLIGNIFVSARGIGHNI